MTLTALRLLAALTLLTGAAYPLAVLAIAQLAFPGPANGSIVRVDGRAVGSALLAQPHASPRYVHPRPSATGHATLPSGASNLPRTSAAVRTRLETAAAHGVTDERAATSGSGLDPHLTPGAARAQLDRVAAARGWNAAQRARAEARIAELTAGGHLGPEHVNILLLNIALDAGP